MMTNVVTAQAVLIGNHRVTPEVCKGRRYWSNVCKLCEVLALAGFGVGDTPLEIRFSIFIGAGSLKGGLCIPPGLRRERRILADLVKSLTQRMG